MQEVVQLFAGNFKNHVGMSHLPGFVWGKGLVPTTAETLVSLNGLSLMTVNQEGKGSVLLASSFLPNRYFLTGFDLQSGMDPKRGFAERIQQDKGNLAPKPSVAYFDRSELPLDAYFQFGFATANYQLRNEFLAYVAKERYGYSVKKVLGPYGRPAMAYQNHFEALPAFRDKEAIQWAELLKQHNMIPSFSLVRAAFDWGQWHEDVTVHLNTGTSAKPHFTGPYVNSYYGSGVRLSGDSGPLLQANYPKYKSLGDPIELPYRAYPALADLDGDGRVDLITGSADGTLAVYRGLGSRPAAYADQPLPEGLTPPDAFGPAEPLQLAGGGPLAAGAYTAPTVLDANGDGRPDLLLGNERGDLLLALGEGGLRFSAPVPVQAGGQPARVGAYAAPAVGDVDGDGIPDLVVGDADGIVRVYRGLAGRPGAFGAPEEAARIRGRFAAPSLRDLNGDGRPDLAVGGSEGDVQVFVRESGGWAKRDPLGGDNLNQMGTPALVGGHNSVPLWYDINHDGKDDLIVGQLEFGPAVALDDPKFPYKAELNEFLTYAKDHYLELYPHLYFHNYLSDEQEKTEIALHRKAFGALNLPWTETGTNQHTWRINNPNRLQTLLNENNAGIWFNFGFRPSHSPSEPQYGPDYMWGLPFQLSDPSVKRPMLIYTPAPNLWENETGSSKDIFEAYIAQDMPIDYFDHIEYHFPAAVSLSDEEKNARRLKYENAMRYVTYTDSIRTQYDYNFMTEIQMAQSFLTTLNSRVTVSQSWGSYLVDRLKDKLGKGVHLNVMLTPAGSVPSQAGGYAGTLGVAIEPGKSFAQAPLAVSSDFHTAQHGTLYAGLAGPTKLGVSFGEAGRHVVRSNVPTEIQKDGAVWTIRLNADGMQQIKLYSPSPLVMEGPDLQIEENQEQHTYTVTHFGAAVSLTVRSP
ncbi:VCBS repeat-containing protein [Paenibacillus sp. CC-CFT747]|nr:VCBS repeat-containing protein [Paenibacillus sp. CC-CFT747]